MNKLQFLEVLSEKLSEELPRSAVLSNLEYYKNYIDVELAKGRSEETIMEELGDPYMIARTIIDAQTGEAFSEQKYAEDVYTEPVEKGSAQHMEKTIIKGNHSCLIGAIIFILIAVAVLAILESVISFLWPILGPVLLILLVLSIFRDKKR